MISAAFHRLSVYLLVSLLFLASLAAQQLRATPASVIVPDGTPVELRLLKNVSSLHAHVGDRLNFVVVRDVNLGDLTVIPAGTLAQGSITQVKGRRILGMGAQIRFRVDSLELSTGDHIGLRASMEVKGHSRTKLMAGAMIATSLIFLPATPVFLLTRGHSSTIVESTEITAQVNGPTPVQSAGLQNAGQEASQLSEMIHYLPPRVFDGEGRQGDMVNLAFVGNEEDLQQAFRRSGWVKTDRWTPLFVWHLVRHRTKDASLPMARFYLFGRVQDYSYALPDPDAIMSRRHHLRIWKTGYTMNGTPIWAGAATYDVAIEIAKGGHIINHRIDPAVDEERDFVGVNLADTSSVSTREYLRSADPVLVAQTASGERYHSDGRILFLDLHQSLRTDKVATNHAAPELEPAPAPRLVPTNSMVSNSK